MLILGDKAVHGIIGNRINLWLVFISYDHNKLVGSITVMYELAGILLFVIILIIILLVVFTMLFENVILQLVNDAGVSATALNVSFAL